MESLPAALGFGARLHSAGLNASFACAFNSWMSLSAGMAADCGMRNQAAYRAGTKRTVSKVAIVSPPMMVTAIGPQKVLRVSGIMARIDAAAVKNIGRARRTVASTTAFHGVRPALTSWLI